ncbi:MAG TPA: COX15/CtaA family protein [Longimicrobium sp.]|nr:COX15/CtaA family protein [Longimicrobium sp.]
MSPHTAQSRFARFAWLTLAFTVGVVLWGAYVRASGAGAGCGRHWPRCNGVVIPRSPSAETLIEFTHRATSGIAFLAVVVVLWMAFRRFPRRHPVRTGAVWSMVLMITEAGVGAGLVLLAYVAGNDSPWRAAWMAVHLLNTFLLLAALGLTAWWGGGSRRVRVRGQGLAGTLALAPIVLVLLVGITGALTALGDTLFPKTSVGFSSGAHFLERLRIVHPLLAVATAAFSIFAASRLRVLRPGRRTARLASTASMLLGIQLAVGMLNVALLAPIHMQIIHLLLADAVWLALVLLAASALGVEDAGPMAVSVDAHPRKQPAAV